MATANQILDGHTGDFTARMQWAQREDGAWFWRFQDRGLWGGWKPGSPPDDRAIATDKFARLPKPVQCPGEAFCAANPGYYKVRTTPADLWATGHRVRLVAEGAELDAHVVERGRGGAVKLAVEGKGEHWIAARGLEALATVVQDAEGCASLTWAKADKFVATKLGVR
jgi:hypothetical protein